jgi:hypothetical protein
MQTQEIYEYIKLVIHGRENIAKRRMDQPTKTNPFVKTPILKILRCIIALYEGSVEVLVVFYRVVKGVRTVVELNLAEKKYMLLFTLILLLLF